MGEGGMTYILHHDDCIEVMRGMPEASVDSIVTDPPYELGFMGRSWDRTGIAYNTDMWREALRVLKPGGHLLAFGGTRTYHRIVVAIENAGFHIRDQIGWLYGSGFPKSRDFSRFDMTAEDGERWAGWGTALKPAWEPICVARKPLIGTVAQNVLMHGTGALNISACRVGISDIDRVVIDSRSGAGHGTNQCAHAGRDDGERYKSHDLGRWPANIIHDGSDEVLAAFPVAPGQQRAVGPQPGAKPSINTYGDFGPRDEFMPRGDSGSAARFFYCAKASRADRNEGCEHMQRKSLHWSSGDQNPGSFQSECTDKTSQNNHPTVKPTDLMAYLCRLVTPPGGVVLDPFMGSGSTGKAAILEGFQFVGIERETEYLDIARARIESAVCQYLAKTAQSKLFGQVAA